MKTKLPQVAIIGRANVGKSTLFNRLIEKNKAIVSKIPGTTRDRNIDIANWQGNEFALIDTGGLDVDQKKSPVKDKEIEINIVRQARQAIANADLILFLIDIKSGVLPIDKELAREIIKQKNKPKTILVANKADSLKWRQYSGELYRLGLGEPIMISAANGSGCGDLLDVIIERISNKQPKDYKSQIISYELYPIKIAIIGKPNTGKSTLLNSILGEERVIVTDIPFTTREAQDVEFNYKNQNFILIDTAGLRKKGKIIPKSLEEKSVEKTIAAIKEADIVLLLTEVQKKINNQDKKITQIILAESKPLIIVANKWDLVPEKDTNTINKYIKYYQTQFPYLWWAPIIFVSAKDGIRTRKILDLIMEIKKSAQIQISDSQLEKFLKSQIKQHRPSRGKGLKNPYIYEIKQIGSTPPRFVMSVNDPKILHFSYIRFIQNNLRKKFNIIGTPIQIELKKWAKN